MKIYKTSNWRDIVEIEAIRVDETNVWLPPLDLKSKYEFCRKEQKCERKNDKIQFWNTIEEAKNYLTDKLNAEILRCEKQIFKAKAKIEALT